MIAVQGTQNTAHLCNMLMAMTDCLDIPKLQLNEFLLSKTSACQNMPPVSCSVSPLVNICKLFDRDFFCFMLPKFKNPEKSKNKSSLINC